MQQLEGLKPAIKTAIVSALEAGQAGNTKIGDLRKIDKVCKVLETDSESIEFEDADFAFIKSRFTSFSNWNSTPGARAIVMEAADILGI